MNHFGGKRKWAIWVPVFVILFLGIASAVVMFLWNMILPAVLGAKAVTYWQALGILVLSKILFGGFGKGGGRPWGANRQKAWKERWAGMSNEDRNRFREEWKKRCGVYPPWAPSVPGTPGNEGGQASEKSGTE